MARTKVVVRKMLSTNMRKKVGSKLYEEVYEELSQKQGGVCAICKNPPKMGRLDMDHDHRTMEVRGLLCRSCNLGLAFVEEHRGAIVRYLKEYST